MSIENGGLNDLKSLNPQPQRRNHEMLSLGELHPIYNNILPTLPAFLLGPKTNLVPRPLQNVVLTASHLLPDPYSWTGEWLLTNPLALIAKGLTYRTQERQFDTRRCQITLHELQRENIGDGYQLLRFTVNAPSPHQLLHNPQIVVGVSKPNKDIGLAFPTDLPPYPGSTTIAAHPEEFIRSLAPDTRMVISAGAASKPAIVFANRFIIQGDLPKNETLSWAIHYGWLNFIFTDPASDLDTTHRNAAIQRCPFQEYRHDESVTVPYNGQMTHYQPQFTIDNSYQVHGAKEFQMSWDSTLNLVAHVLDYQQSPRVMFVSGNWWWNIHPLEVPDILKNIAATMNYTLVEAYSVDTGGQTGFYYKNSQGQFCFSHEGRFDNFNHTTVSIIKI